MTYGPFPMMLRNALARAICRSLGADPKQPRTLGDGLPYSHRVPLGRAWSAWEVHLPEADAVIEAAAKLQEEYEE